MKQLAFLLLLLPLFAYTQKTFAPLNAVWNYEQKSNLDPLTNICSGNHIQYRVDEEIIIDGKDCSIIRAYGSAGGSPNFSYSGDSLIVFQDQDKIYFQQDTAFLLLFDFGAQVGDTIVSYDPVGRGLLSGFQSPPSDTTLHRIIVQVAEVSTESVGGQDRRVLRLFSIDEDEFLPSHIIMEGIGSLSLGFPGFFFVTTADGCNGGFVCYKDDSFRYDRRNFNVPHPGCDFTESVGDALASEVTIYPNPFDSEIRIDTDLQNFQLRLLDINGRVVMQRTNAVVLDTDELDPGLYILQLVVEGRVYTKKVMRL
jgi:hypothetical protein